MIGTLCATTGLLVGCTAPLPEVTFYGNGVAEDSAPGLWCRVNAAATAVACSVDRGDTGAAELSLGAGQGVVVNVPVGISDTPWTIVFRYTDAAGTEVDARTALFGAGELTAYELRPPAADDQLTRVEVQSGLTLVAGEAGGVDVAVLRSWVLVVRPSGSGSASGSAP